MTPYQAAQKLAKHLKTQGHDAVVWTRDDAVKNGHSAMDAAVVCEGVDLVTMQLRLEGPFSSMQPWDGVFCEPYRSSLMAFYRKIG